MLTSAVLVWGPKGEVDCRSAAVTAGDGVTVQVCRREYERTREPLTGAYLADAMRRTGEIEEAVALANRLLDTPVRADALRILGKIALTQKRTDDAINLLEDARALDRRDGNRREVARDDLAIAEVQAVRARYAEALQVLEEATVEAVAAGDTLAEAYCHLSAARVLIRVGYFEAAGLELDRAARQLSREPDLAQLWFVRGQLAQEFGRGHLRPSHHHQAVVSFLRSLELAQRAGAIGMLPNLHLNLAFSLAELGQTSEADEHLTQAGVLDRTESYAVQRREIAARIAYRRGNYALASALNTQVYPTIEDDDERIDLCVMQARIALAAGDLAAAELWAQRGVEGAERVRAAQAVSELRPWVLASRRAPFEVLFSVYARAVRVEDALAVFDRWQGRTLLDEMARPATERPGLESTATEIQGLRQWLPDASTAPPTRTDTHAVTQTLHQIDLVALAVAENRVWRVTASHGRLGLDDLGKLDDLRERFDRFSASPTDPLCANVT